jgi:S-adenosylmethionine:tRNA-ribosyltransferase-isomerase (queuine synthetase)
MKTRPTTVADCTYACYTHAIAERYRCFSHGDACLIERRPK